MGEVVKLSEDVNDTSRLYPRTASDAFRDPDYASAIQTFGPKRITWLDRALRWAAIVMVLVALVLTQV